MSITGIGVVGAGTMGAGIAQLGCLAGVETLLHDPLPDALERGQERLAEGLAKGAERGRWSNEEARAAGQRLRPCEQLQELGDCELVIEAAPEELDLKRDLFARLEEACAPGAVLATNTSSLSVTAIAAGLSHPERVCGMHFFNPPPLMKLVEIVAGEESAEESLAAAEELARRMDRTPVRAADEIGFLANRVARPFSLEGLRLLGERLADHETIDRICRLGAGFRMGPFELMDLVGIDVNFAVARSFWEQSFHEPRWQPHPIQARLAAAGTLGRKTGRGFYSYRGDEHRPADPEPPPASGQGLVAIAGEGVLADELRELARTAGYEVAGLGWKPERDPVAIVDASLTEAPEELGGPLVEGPAIAALPVEAEAPPTAILLAAGSRAELDPTGGSIGFHAVPPVRLVELTAGSDALPETGEAVARFFSSLGLFVEWVGDAPALVLGRIVSQIVNEAAFALERGVGSAEDIDTAMRLGFAWPRGPLEWGDEIGLDHVLTVLDALHYERGEERYRAAPLLRRLVAEGRLGRPTGEGFFRR